MIRRFLLLFGTLAVGLQSAWGFALLGPLPGSGTPTWTGPGGEVWQTSEIGYNQPGDEGGPHNIGEEYRRNVPVYYYAYNANFLGFFGSNGVVETDRAFDIMNSVFTNNPTGLINGLDGYSADLSEFPMDTRHFNLQAQTLALTDLKSMTLSLLVEQMGLAEPERYVWALHDRLHVGNIACPVGMEYTVVKRNFDLVDSALDQIQYSSYVNGNLYTYFIQEFCQNTPWLAYTVPFTTDPLNNDLTAVASFGLLGIDSGAYYSGLTRDDVGGLRYLLSTNNLNIENAAAGSLLQTTNPQPQSLLTTLPISLLLTTAFTSDPDTLQTNYPGLNIISVTTNIVVQVTNNVVPYFTNQSELPVFSNTVVGGLPNVTSPTNLYYFTNQPGPTVINYDRTAPFTTISTLDLATFLDQAKTNDPATLQALYPALQIIRYTTSPGYVWVTNYISYLTNLTGAPYQGAPKLVTVAQSWQPVWVTNWNYTFGNVFTNHYYTNRFVTVQSIWITNQIGAPYGSPFIAKTNLTTYKTNLVSGDVFLIPTNWCGFDLTLAFPLGNPPFKTGLTNVVIFPGYNTNGVTGTNNLVGGNSFGLAQSTYDIYTNYNYAVYPGLCESVLAFATNYTTNIVTVYAYNFGNIVTNSYYTNSPLTVITTNITLVSGGYPGQLVTNVTTTVNYNGISGDFFIVPPTWCDYKILSNLLTTVTGTTNTIIATNSTGSTNVGQYYSQTTITSNTNHTFLIQISTCQGVPATARLRQGIEKIKFVRANYDSLLGQFFRPVTNTYAINAVTNSQIEHEFFQRIVTEPDFLLTADDLIDGPGNATLGRSYVARSMNFDQGNLLPGLAGPGLVNGPTVFTYNKSGALFSQGLITLGTNSTLLSEFTQIPLMAWGSFDSSTNAPVVYPNGTSIQNLVNQVLVQISPATLPAGTHGVAYPPQTFSATGGSFAPPFTWALAIVSAGLPPGLTLSADGTLSGTPTQVGTFDFIIQLTDSLSRNVQWNYSITIQ